jgi:hypothetical protein
MYILSTIIFVIRKVFYEAENGQTNGSKAQAANTGLFSKADAR